MFIILVPRDLPGLVGFLTCSCVAECQDKCLCIKVRPMLLSLLHEQLMGLFTLGKAKTLHNNKRAPNWNFFIFLSVSSRNV